MVRASENQRLYRGRQLSGAHSDRLWCYRMVTTSFRRLRNTERCATTGTGVAYRSILMADITGAIPPRGENKMGAYAARS